MYLDDSLHSSFGCWKMIILYWYQDVHLYVGRFLLLFIQLLKVIKIFLLPSKPESISQLIYQLQMLQTALGRFSFSFAWLQKIDQAFTGQEVIRWRIDPIRHYSWDIIALSWDKLAIKKKYVEIIFRPSPSWRHGVESVYPVYYGNLYKSLTLNNSRSALLKLVPLSL